MEYIQEIIEKISPYYKKKGRPSAEHILTYDSPTETLEPVYFWILDFLNGMFGGDVEKIVDNFCSSPGSGHFSELQGKASHMQQEASRVLGVVNSILKGIINLIYDLKEFKLRLKQYENAKSNNKLESEAGLLALKQIWMDRVDLQRGQGSINALTAGNLNFVTLRDAFLVINSIKQIDNIDLNERVKRILKPRVQEFFEWKKRSEQELKKRFEIEKIYLKSQVNALKLNARWAKPYLKASQRLTSNNDLSTDPALVNVFNTILLQLSLMGKNKINIDEEIISKNLPKDFKKIKNLRDYYPIIFVDFKFRGIPSKAGQHYVFGGRVEIGFKAYALNNEEFLLFKEKLNESDLEDSLKLVEGMTDDSLLQLKVDIEEFFSDKEEDKNSEKGLENTDPFSALFAFLKPNKKTKDKSKDSKEQDKEKIKILKKIGIKPDKYPEKYLRSLAEANAINNCYNVFDIYKKAHGMASLPYVKEAEKKAPISSSEKFFGFK